MPLLKTCIICCALLLAESNTISAGNVCKHYGSCRSVLQHQAGAHRFVIVRCEAHMKQSQLSKSVYMVGQKELTILPGAFFRV